MKELTHCCFKIFLIASLVMLDQQFASCSMEMLKRWALLLLVCTICFDCICGITVPCDQPYPAENGNLCYPCSAGHYKVSDCLVNGDQARCRPCENGKYQPDCDNVTRCETCKRFCNDHRQVIVKNCTATTNIVCQCRVGYYWKHDESKPDEVHCQAHSKCKTGEGLIAVGTPYEDTKCAPCKEGVTFSSNDSFGTCLPCFVCSSTVAIPCTSERDSVCNRPPETSSKDGGNSKVTDVVIPVLVALAVVIGAVVLGVCLYRTRRRNNEKNITNGIKHGQCVEVPSSQMENGFHLFPYSSRDPGNTATHKGNFRNAGNTKSTEELKKSLNTHNNITDEDQKRVDDINKKSKDCSIRLRPEKNFRSNCTNKREEGLQNGLKASNTEMESKENERHRSVLGDRTASSDSKEKVLESNENVIYERQNNAVNEVSNSKLNDTVHDDNSVDISMDVVCVSARNSGKRVLLSAVDSGKNRVETNCEEYHVTGTNVSSEAEQAKGETQQDGGYGPTTIGTSEVRSTTCDLIEKDWQKVMVFLPRHLSWSDFKMFNRNLTADTNQELHRTVEADMDNAFLEAHYICREAMFKLIIRWRQATPEATIQDVFRALESSRLNLVAERLKSKIDNVHAPGKRVVIVEKSDNEQNVVEVFPRGELPASDTLQTVTNGVLANGRCSNNLQMMKLKV